MKHRKIVTIARLKKQLDEAFKKYIRNRDALGSVFVCISCGEIKGLDQMHAGHFWSAGKYTAVRWNEENVHGQCISCNMFLHGNLYKYSQRLKEKIGEERFKALEAEAHKSVKLDREWLQQRITHYRNLISSL